MEQAYHQEGNREPPVRRPSGSVEDQITADSEFRERQRLYEKARHDEVAALRHARDKGFIKGFIESITEGHAAESMTGRFAEIMAESLAKGMTKGRAEIMSKSLAESMAQVAQKMKAMGFSNEQIQKVTG